MKNFDWKLTLIIVGILAAVGLCATFVVQSYPNKAYTMEENVNTALKDIRVQEKRRYDTIYNLADCIESYNAHESEVIRSIAEGRGAYGNAEIWNVQKVVSAIAEAYPELKSNENYKTFMNELITTENLIAEHRSNYNKQVKEYNRFVKKFPARNFLDMTGYEVIVFEDLELNDPPVDAPQNLFDREK